jgi:hypothetical protein
LSFGVSGSGSGVLRLGFRVRGLGFEGVSGFRVWEGFGVPGSGSGAWFRVLCSWFGLRFRVYILLFMVLGFMVYILLGFMVLDLEF